MSDKMDLPRRVARAVRAELGGLHVRLLLAQMILAFLPRPIGFRIRPLVLRLAGFRLGRGTIMFGTPDFQGPGDIYHRLIVGDCCRFSPGCLLELGGDIHIGDRVVFGHEVMVLTTTHDSSDPRCRCGPLVVRPVRIEDGVWLGARSVVLPGVTIGAGAVIGAGAMVTRDVPPNTVVAGVPARIVKVLDGLDGAVQHAVVEAVRR